MEIILEKYVLSHSYLQVWKSLLSARYLQVKNLDAYNIVIQRKFISLFTLHFVILRFVLHHLTTEFCQKA